MAEGDGAEYRASPNAINMDQVAQMCRKTGGSVAQKELWNKNIGRYGTCLKK